MQVKAFLAWLRLERVEYSGLPNTPDYTADFYSWKLYRSA
jgi:hypothetical protein